MIYLGIIASHNSSASLMINGEIVCAFQEERFTGVKNWTGYPKQAIDACLNYVRKRKLIIDKAGFATINNHAFGHKYPLQHYFDVKDYHRFYTLYYSKHRKKYEKKYLKDKRNNLNLYLDYKNLKPKDEFNFHVYRDMQIKFLKKQSKNLIKNIVFLDHHTCHAYYAFYSSLNKKNNSCILTLDSEGDALNQTVWIYKNKKMKKILKNNECDLARIYKFITCILKMKPDEHEFKVMGLAAYSKKKYILEIYNKVFKDILRVKGVKICHNKRPKDLYGHLLNLTKHYRFDNIAGALQYFTENIVTQLLKNIYKKYKIKNFYFAGGVAMNVKLFKDIGNLKFIKYIHVPASAADESLSIGACYFMSNDNKKLPITNIYLGRGLLKTEKNVDQNDLIDLFPKKKFVIKNNFSHQQLSVLLARNEVIAVVRGKEEFGARALGNRSIIANPSEYEVVKKINESIKNRDFWMPFALTILKGKHKKFIKNNKNFRADFMTMTFDTIEKNLSLIKAGCHPYDKTVRPQILEKKFNPQYHSLIKEFYKTTNIPALLNTSLNLHGNPVASILSDVAYTFKNSGLKYLYVDDKFLISKKNSLNT
jgi:carbamoyltransferase